MDDLVADQEPTLRTALELLTSPSPATIAADLPTGAALSPSDRRRLSRQVKRTAAWNLGGNVVGYGIAEKQAGAGGTGALALTIYVKKKYPPSLLAPPQLIPATLELEGLAEPVPTDVREIGELRPEALTSRVRPVLGGYSIGHLLNTGTAGCLVVERGGGERLLLSNSHILAASGTAQAGDPIYQPGPDDHGTAPDVVATLRRWQPFEFGAAYPNRIDAALADPVDDALFSPDVFNIGRPKGARPPAIGMRVQKSGRVTGHTRGEIRDVNFRFPLRYPHLAGLGFGDVRFRDQVLCTRYAVQGDSGALVLDDDGFAVGLHFAGSPSASVFNPIQFVLDDLGVDLVT